MDKVSLTPQRLLSTTFKYCGHHTGIFACEKTLVVKSPWIKIQDFFRLQNNSLLTPVKSFSGHPYWCWKSWTWANYFYGQNQCLPKKSNYSKVSVIIYFGLHWHEFCYLSWWFWKISEKENSRSHRMPSRTLTIKLKFWNLSSHHCKQEISKEQYICTLLSFSVYWVNHAAFDCCAFLWYHLIWSEKNTPLFVEV